MCIRDSVNEEWENIRCAIFKVADEVLGKTYKSRRKCGVKMSDEEIAQVIEPIKTKSI